MPQEHYVLRCYSCETFQVQIVKKATKWECKLCGAKQSLKRNYGRGNAKDCRTQVMKLNELRLTEPNKSIHRNEEFLEEASPEKPKEEQPVEKKTFISKWTEYLDEEKDEESVSEEDMTNVCNEIHKKRQSSKKTPDRQMNSKKRKICSDLNTNEISPEIKVESNHWFVDLSFQKDPEFKESTQKENDKNFFCNPKFSNITKATKYSKYLDDSEGEHQQEKPDNSLKTIKKISNIFDTDLNDLDSILNF